MASPCRLILALDVETKEEALALARPLAGNLAWVKLGLQLFTRHGPGIVDEFHALGFKVFLDLKFHDIPNTVSSAIKSLKGRPCSLLTIHACGGPEMIARAAEAAKSALPDCTVLGVTVLTSMDQAQLSATGVARTPEEQVRLLGRMAIGAGIGGLVCSPLELPVLRGDLGAGPTLVTPGIRYPDAAGDDQNRIMTPAQAAAAGASFIVVGRPILKAKDPAAETLRIRRDIGEKRMSAGDDILILLAAGSARRMQSVVDDKTTALLAGKPVFVHSLQSFLSTGLIGQVVITYRDAAQLAKLQELLATHLPSASAVRFVPGGESRQDSVLAALNTCEGHAGLAHIHDGARPLVSADAIRKVRAKASETGAAILAGRAADTVKIAKANSASVETSPDRGLVWTAETPQVFRTAVVLKAYRKVAELQRKVTDDSSAVEFVGQDVSLVENPSVNLKLTRPADFVLAEAILKTR